MGFRFLLVVLQHLVSASADVQLRRLLQRGDYHEAATYANKLGVLDSPACLRSDGALAAWLTSGGGAEAAEAALSVFLGIGRDPALPSNVRVPALKNAAHVETTRDGSEEKAQKWANYDRAYQLSEEVQSLLRADLDAAISRRLPEPAPAPWQHVPLTTFDLDLNARICADPSLSPPEGDATCGDRDTLPPNMADGSAPSAAVELARRTAAAEAAWVEAASSANRVSNRTAVRTADAPGVDLLGASSHSVALSGAATAQLHLDLTKRSLSSFVAGDRGRKGWEPSVKELTSNLATGPVSCDDAGGTACLEAYALTFRGFGLAGESYGSASSPGAVTSLSLATLTHLQLAVERVLERGVPGDLIEAGVFRGGATILMRAALAAHADGALLAKAAGPDGGKRRELRPELRRVFVADSFAGIPASRRAVADGLTEECDGWEERYAVDDQTVRSNFRRYGMLDARVVLVKGFFNVSLPPIFSKAPEADEADEADEAPELAVVRIDADAYDGVRDALEVRKKALVIRTTVP